MAVSMRSAVLGARDKMNQLVEPYLYIDTGELAQYKLMQADAMEMVARELLDGAKRQREVYEKAKKE